jgi:predicted metal-dependent hydrolase
MSQKTITIEGIGDVTVGRRKGTRSLRLSIRSDGRLRVGAPSWVTEKAIVAFVRSQQDWIDANMPDTQPPLTPDMPVGKFHRLVFAESERSTRVSTRVVGAEVRVTHPAGYLYRDKHVQEAAVRAIERMLKREAEQLLPGRLERLARQHDFSYASISVKRLHTRWGSCSSRQDIILNSMLMQLPWQLIDYVIMHELLHTRMMRHGAPFWSELANYVPDLANVRRQMKQHSPSVISAVTVANDTIT